MAVTRQQGIAEALTHDHHFEQEGFTALLRG
jgi:predicted nucleic acid-binding protein